MKAILVYDLYEEREELEAVLKTPSQLAGLSDFAYFLKSKVKNGDFSEFGEFSGKVRDLVEDIYDKLHECVDDIW